MWKKDEWVIFIASLLVIAFFTETSANSWNDQSRMAAIQSIVEFRTFIIDQSKFVSTLDKVRINDHFYSDKPPLSYIIAVPIYFILYKLGITFSEWPHLSYYLITLLSIGLITSLMMVYFFRFLKRYSLSTKQRFFYVASLSIGTLVLPFSTIFNSHTLGAAFILLAYYAILNAKKTMHYVLGGILAGLAAAIDLAAGHIFLITFIVFLFVKNRFAKTSLFFLGALIPILVQSAINWHISGSIIPFGIRPEFFNYPGSRFGPGTLSGIATNTLPKALHYAFGITIGSKAGFLYYSPILYFSLIGLIVAIFNKKFRIEGITVFAGILMTLFYLVFKTNNYGGCAFGMRFTVSLIPILYSFTPLAFSLKSKRMVAALKLLFILTFVASVAFSLTGTIDPWTCDKELSIMKQPLIKLFARIFHYSV